jgi:two-component system nitrate/nitrite response regulator NarL
MPLRVLLVDDNLHFLQAARSLLEREGLTVAAVASTGAEAVARARETEPDVVLLDIDLGPESGLDVADRLVRGQDGDRRGAVILVSTYAAEDVSDLVEASPAVGFLSKSDLSAAAIVGLLGRAAGGDER